MTSSALRSEPTSRRSRSTLANGSRSPERSSTGQRCATSAPCAARRDAPAGAADSSAGQARARLDPRRACSPCARRMSARRSPRPAVARARRGTRRLPGRCSTWGDRAPWPRHRGRPARRPRGASTPRCPMRRGRAAARAARRAGWLTPAHVRGSGTRSAADVCDDVGGRPGSQAAHTSGAAEQDAAATPERKAGVDPVERAEHRGPEGHAAELVQATDAHGPSTHGRRGAVADNREQARLQDHRRDRLDRSDGQDHRKRLQEGIGRGAGGDHDQPGGHELAPVGSVRQAASRASQHQDRQREQAHRQPDDQRAVAARRQILRPDHVVHRPDGARPRRARRSERRCRGCATSGIAPFWPRRHPAPRGFRGREASTRDR